MSCVGDDLAPISCPVLVMTWLLYHGKCVGDDLAPLSCRVLVMSLLYHGLCCKFICCVHHHSAQSKRWVMMYAQMTCTR